MSENVPAAFSRKRIPVIRNPDMTKNTSTPTKPPGMMVGKAWNATTHRTATARSPSMSGRHVELPSAMIGERYHATHSGVVRGEKAWERVRVGHGEWNRRRGARLCSVAVAKADKAADAHG